MNENLRQRDDTIRKRDEKIRELTFQVNILQQELRLKNQRLAQGFGLEGAGASSTVAAPSSSSSQSSGQSDSTSSSRSAAAIVIAADDVSNTQLPAPVASEKPSSRSKRPALGERTNSLANDSAPAANHETKKTVKIADQVVDNVPPATKATKSVRIDA